MESIIEKIHHDINTAYLDKFRIASEIIDREKVDSNKYDIAKLGFKSYESEISKSAKIKASKEYIETINRLKIDYPYKKFITYDQIGKILEKYPLVLSTPDRFIGEIPEKNIKDILNFKLKDCDKGFNPFPNINSTIKHDAEHYKIVEIVNSLIYLCRYREVSMSHMEEYYEKKVSEQLENLKSQHGFALINKVIKTGEFDFKRYRCKDIFCIDNYLFKIESSRGYTILSETHSLLNSDYVINVTPAVDSFHKPEFWILATADQFDIKSTEVAIGGCIKEVGEAKQISLLKDDPIIFKPIKEGLIVVTQWGPEANLPEFINSDNN